DPRTVESLSRAGDAYVKAGSDGKAKDVLARALAAAGGGRGKRGGGGAASGDPDARYWAAQARYLQGELVFHEYERLKIAGKPKQLAKVLDEKAKLRSEE